MGSIDLVIMACPRAGTKYTSTVLNACGLRTFHERYFTPLNPHAAGEAIRYDGKFGEVSSGAYGFRKSIPKRALILHQTRHPIRSINSLFYTTHCNWNTLGETIGQGPNAKRWNRHYWSCIDGDSIQWKSDRIDRCAQFYFAMNDRIGQYVRRTRGGFTFRVEDLSADLVGDIFKSIGQPFDRGLAESVIESTARTINRIGKEPAQAFAWDNLTGSQKVQSEAFGYGPEGLK